jgi:hypothetical protein
MLTDIENHHQIETAAAMYVLDVFDLPMAAMIAGVTQEELEAVIASPAVEAECLRLQSDNRITELRAAFGLDAVVERLVASIAELDSQSGLIRTGEFLHRVSGLQERRAAEMKQNGPAAPQFRLNIILHNEDGSERVMRLGGNRK